MHICNETQSLTNCTPTQRLSVPHQTCVRTVPPASRHPLVAIRRATVPGHNVQQAGLSSQALARSASSASTNQTLGAEAVCHVLPTHTALSQGRRRARAMPASRKSAARVQVAVLGHTRKDKATESAQAVVPERTHRQALRHHAPRVCRAKQANTQQGAPYAIRVQRIQHLPRRAAHCLTADARAAIPGRTGARARRV